MGDVIKAPRATTTCLKGSSSSQACSTIVCHIEEVTWLNNWSADWEQNTLKYRCCSSLSKSRRAGGYSRGVGWELCEVTFGTIFLIFLDVGSDLTSGKYPLQAVPNVIQRLQNGFVSSHFTRRLLQVLQPVLTLGALTLERFSITPSPNQAIRIVEESATYVNVRCLYSEREPEAVGGEKIIRGFVDLMIESSSTLNWAHD